MTLLRQSHTLIHSKFAQIITGVALCTSLAYSTDFTKNNSSALEMAESTRIPLIKITQIIFPNLPCTSRCMGKSQTMTISLLGFWRLGMLNSLSCKISNYCHVWSQLGAGNDLPTLNPHRSTYKMFAKFTGQRQVTLNIHTYRKEWGKFHPNRINKLLIN